jgi:hypothetical protein
MSNRKSTFNEHLFISSLISLLLISFCNMYHIFLFNLLIPIINIDIIIASNDVNEYIHIYNNEMT